jgi:fido (protein-threonine AMPylation protein)
VNIAQCLDALLDDAPEDITITPDWIRSIHQRIAGELFPDWAGSFRHTDVQVGTRLPPQGFNVPVYVGNFCLDLAERMQGNRMKETLDFH